MTVQALHGGRTVLVFADSLADGPMGVRYDGAPARWRRMSADEATAVASDSTSLLSGSAASLEGLSHDADTTSYVTANGGTAFVTIRPRAGGTARTLTVPVGSAGPSSTGGYFCYAWHESTIEDDPNPWGCSDATNALPLSSASAHWALSPPGDQLVLAVTRSATTFERVVEKHGCTDGFGSPQPRTEWFCGTASYRTNDVGATVYVVDLATGASRVLATVDGAGAMWPSISEDGTELQFLRVAISSGFYEEAYILAAPALSVIGHHLVGYPETYAACETRFLSMATGASLGTVCVRCAGSRGQGGFGAIRIAERPAAARPRSPAAPPSRPRWR